MYNELLIIQLRLDDKLALLHETLTTYFYPKFDWVKKIKLSNEETKNEILVLYNKSIS